MKKIKMNSCALAIIIIQGIYYESKQENVTKELNLHNFLKLFQQIRKYEAFLCCFRHKGMIYVNQRLTTFGTGA